MVCLYEYVWIDADGNLRSKTKVMTSVVSEVENLPIWNYDGSSTRQAEGNDSEVLIRPCAIFSDPFHKLDSGIEGSYLVMCDTYLPNMEPHPTNSRYPAQETFDKYSELESKFGIEQEFFVKHRDVDGENSGRVLGFGEHKLLKPAPQGQYYCSIGSNNAFGRDFIMEAFHNCLKAGLNLTGMNAEVAPGQWEFQVCADGIAAADQLYIMRYILGRTGESFGYSVDFHPKPVDSVEWNGSGCHTNFSTKAMREEGGYEVIKSALNRLGNYQELCMQNYGVDNNKRMTGELETSNFSEFSWGVANRGCSVRIPNNTVAEGKGYFEDRRPASNMDPYVVTSLLVELTAEPVAEESEPVAEESEPVAEESEPVAEESEPVAEESEPVAEESEPEIENLLPATSFSNTTVTTEAESIFNQQPNCDGDVCTFECSSRDNCANPLTKTIKSDDDALNFLTATKETNPFDSNNVDLSYSSESGEVSEKSDNALNTTHDSGYISPPEPAQEPAQEDEKKDKFKFSSYSDYFNLINKKN